MLEKKNAGTSAQENEVTTTNVTEVKNSDATNLVADERKKTILTFHIGRGGSFHNPGYLTCKGVGDITQCSDWNHLFLYEEDEDGNELPLEDKGLFDCSGNQIMDWEDYEIACCTGIGRLDLDGKYDTTYACYASECDEYEINAFVDSCSSFSCFEFEILEEMGFERTAFQVANHFDDLVGYLTGYEPEEYLNRYYNISEEEPEDGEDYFQLNGIYYTEL